MSATGAAQDYNPSTGALSRTVTMSNKCARFASGLLAVSAGLACEVGSRSSTGRLATVCGWEEPEPLQRQRA